MNIVKLGVVLILAGFVCIFAGAAFHGAEFGGVVLIGPVPLVFGSSPEMTVISILLAIILMVLYFIFWRRTG